MENAHQLERDELLILLQNSSTLRTGQDQVVWSIFGAFWATNALLLISLFSVGEKWDENIVGILISIIGISISYIWTSIQLRSINRIQMHEDAMQYIENELKLPIEVRSYSVPPLVSIIPLFSIRIKTKARDTMRFCCPIVLSIWTVTLIYFICKVII
jgi:hypothetical protein